MPAVLSEQVRSRPDRKYCDQAQLAVPSFITIPLKIKNKTLHQAAYETI